jgi:integrase
MRGLFKRKGSDNWQGKFRIPESLWKRRADLAKAGASDLGRSQEFGKSLGTHDRIEAARRYRLALDAWDEKIAAWMALLENGPTSLTHKQRIALAADYAKAFLAKHEDEPGDAPPSPPAPEPRADEGRLADAVRTLPVDEQRRLIKSVRAYRAMPDDDKKVHRAVALIADHPVLSASLGADFAQALEQLHGAEANASLAAKRLHVNAEARQLLNFELASLMGAAQRGLERRQDGDYRPVEELAAAPSFTSSAPASDRGQALTLEGLLDHKAATQTLKDKTVRDTRSHVRKFATFIGHDDARRVTRDDVRNWRDHLMAEGKLHPKTISDRYLAAVKSVLEHGVREFDLPTNVASNIKDNRVAPALGRSKGYTEAEAVTILEATFRGSTKRLSAPHRRAIFWVPWILAYTGLRVNEVTQFRARHLKEDNGVPYLLITPEDGSTKGKGGGKAWMVGIHEHLIEMGLLEFIRSFGDGPIFYEPYPAGTDLAAIKEKPRWAEAANRVTKWIKDEVGINAPLGRPNHAWRHQLTTRSRQYKMNKEARDFMLGSGPGDAREGYGDWPPERLSEEINKLPRFAVKDTGTAPA